MKGIRALANIRATVESGDEQVQAASTASRSGFISAFVLCTPEYRASFQNDVARFISTLCRVALFKDLMTLDYSKREVKSAAVLAAEVVASDGAQRDTCKVSVEVRKAIPPAIAAAVGCAAETTKRLEFILEMSRRLADGQCRLRRPDGGKPAACQGLHPLCCVHHRHDRQHESSTRRHVWDSRDTQHLHRSPIVETIVSAAQGREFDDAQTLSETLRGETFA